VVPTAAELGTPEDIDSTLTTLISWYASTDSEADAEQATPEDPIAKVPIHYGGAITTDSEADDELATPESVAAEEPVRHDSVMATDMDADAKRAALETLALQEPHCREIPARQDTVMATDAEADAELASPELPIFKEQHGHDSVVPTDSEADAEPATSESVTSNIVVANTVYATKSRLTTPESLYTPTSSSSDGNNITDVSGGIRLAKRTVALKRPPRLLHLRRSRRQAKAGGPEYVHRSTDDGGRMVRNLA